MIALLILTGLSVMLMPVQWPPTKPHVNDRGNDAGHCPVWVGALQIVLSAVVQMFVHDTFLVAQCVWQLNFYFACACVIFWTSETSQKVCCQEVAHCTVVPPEWMFRVVHCIPACFVLALCGGVHGILGWCLVFGSMCVCDTVKVLWIVLLSCVTLSCWWVSTEVTHVRVSSECQITLCQVTKFEWNGQKSLIWAVSTDKRIPAQLRHWSAQFCRTTSKTFVVCVCAPTVSAHNNTKHWLDKRKQLSMKNCQILLMKGRRT